MTLCCSYLLNSCTNISRQTHIDLAPFSNVKEKTSAQNTNYFSVAMKVIGLLLFYYSVKGYWNALIYKSYSMFGLVFRAITFVVGHELLTIGDNLFQLYCLKPAEKVVT